MRAAARDQVRHAAGTVRTLAFLAGSEVVHSRGARREAVNAAQQRRVAVQVSRDTGIVELMRVDHRVLARERVADPLLRREPAIVQRRRRVNGHAGRRFAELVAGGQHVHFDACASQRRGAGFDMGRNAAIACPPRRDEQNRSCHPRDPDFLVAALAARRRQRIIATPGRPADYSSRDEAACQRRADQTRLRDGRRPQRQHDPRHNAWQLRRLLFWR